MLVRISNISVQESISGVECQVFGLKLFRIASNQIRVEIYTDRFSLPSSVSRSVDRIRIESRSSIESDLSRRGRSLPSKKINDQKSIVTDRKRYSPRISLYKKRTRSARIMLGSDGRKVGWKGKTLPVIIIQNCNESGAFRKTAL